MIFYTVGSNDTAKWAIREASRNADFGERTEAIDQEDHKPLGHFVHHIS